MKGADDFKKAEGTVTALRKLWPDYLARIKQSSCDKYGFGLNEDSRFSIAKVELSLDTHVGNYGSSSCYTFGSVGDPALFRAAFVRVLNMELPSLLEKTAALIEKDSEAAKAAYIKTLKDELARVEGGAK